jgi:hypothetical protein
MVEVLIGPHHQNNNNRISRYSNMSAETVSVSTKFGIFQTRPVHMSDLEKTKTA